jgi:hypothetical protein
MHLWLGFKSDPQEEDAMKKAKGKIKLHRETLRQLGTGEMGRVPGAVVTGGPGPAGTCQTTCNPNTGCGMCWYTAVTK